MRDISSRFGVMVSFEKPVYMNGLFQGFDGWDAMNAHFGANNITYIVRVEFELPSFKENRIKRRFRLFWSVAKKVDPGLYIKVECMYKMLCMAKLSTLHGFTKGVSGCFVLLNKCWELFIIRK